MSYVADDDRAQTPLRRSGRVGIKCQSAAGSQTPKILFQKCLVQILEAKCFSDSKKDKRMRRQIYNAHRMNRIIFSEKWLRWKSTAGAKILIEHKNGDEATSDSNSSGTKRKAEAISYKEAHKLCTKLMKKVSAEEAAENVKTLHGFSPHPTQLRLHVRRHNGGGHGVSPTRRGRQSFIPIEVEKELVDMLMYFKDLGLVITINYAISFFEHIIEGTTAQAKFNTRKKKQDYFYRLIRKPEHKLSLGKCFTVDGCRLKWSKSYIIKSHYDTVKKILLDCGFAKLNPQYKEGSGGDELILLEKRRILSFDETRVKLDQTDDHLKTIGPKGEKKSGNP